MNTLEELKQERRYGKKKNNNNRKAEFFVSNFKLSVNIILMSMEKENARLQESKEWDKQFTKKQSKEPTNIYKYKLKTQRLKNLKTISVNKEVENGAPLFCRTSTPASAQLTCSRVCLLFVYLLVF